MQNLDFVRRHLRLHRLRLAALGEPERVPLARRDLGSGPPVRLRLPGALVGAGLACLSEAERRLQRAPRLQPTKAPSSSSPRSEARAAVSLKDYLTRVGARVERPRGSGRDPDRHGARLLLRVPGADDHHLLQRAALGPLLLRRSCRRSSSSSRTSWRRRCASREPSPCRTRPISSSARPRLRSWCAPYIEKMTRSELMAIMVGGFANTAGGVLGAYVMMLSGYFPEHRRPPDLGVGALGARRLHLRQGHGARNARSRSPAAR